MELSDLIELAREAESGFEKAAVFAAVDAIDQMFRRDDESFGGYTLEKVGKVRRHLAAALGYDVDNGYDSESHIVWAMGALSTLQNLLERRRRARSGQDV